MLCKKLFFASVMCILLSFPIISLVDASSVMWSRTYGGADDDIAYSLVETSDGGYALAGYTYSFGAGSADCWLIKTDADGNMEWNQTYGGAGDDIAHSLVETSEGGYAIAGGKLLVKTDAYGNMEWNKTYSGLSARYLITTSDGGFAIVGGTNIKINYAEADFYLIKTDAYGNIEWNRTYSKEVDYAKAVVETSEGGYAIAGSSGFWTARACWLVKTDENGLMKLSKNYGGLYDNYDELASSLVETIDEGFVLAGQTNSFGAGGYDCWLVKTDANGNIEWNQTYGGAGDDIAHSLVATSDGGYAIAGETSSFGAGGSDFLLIKTNEQGIIPEFTPWTIVPLLLGATLMSIIYKKRLSKTADS
ncbi:MAG: hypothetical protein IAX21_01730 [Candidatus Bathyarchaeota archaeon]|nr:MAG: hypothetical protein IAX21_01730 [Candidatus Bathyarchaeota archaeon]